MLGQKRKATPSEATSGSLTAPSPALPWDRIRKDPRFQHLLVINNGGIFTN